MLTVVILVLLGSTGCIFAILVCPRRQEPHGSYSVQKLTVTDQDYALILGSATKITGTNLYIALAQHDWKIDISLYRCYWSPVDPIYIEFPLLVNLNQFEFRAKMGETKDIEIRLWRGGKFEHVGVVQIVGKD